MGLGWRNGLISLIAAAALSACGGGGASKPQAQAPTEAQAAAQSQPQIPAPGKPAPKDIVTEEFRVSTKDDGVQLYLRNKHFYEYYDASPEKTVLFVHGATFPGSATFDLQLDGVSWMDWMAKRGYDVYSVDLRGYGRSSRPAAMGQPAEANPPQVDSAQALEDLSRAINFIASRRNLERINLVGWSWGATLTGAYAAKASQRVERLVLYSPQWLREEAPPAELEKKLGAWRAVPLAGLRERWVKDVPERDQRELAPQSWSDALVAALKAADPDGAAMKQPSLKAPNGAVADVFKFWSAGQPVWKPQRVSVPTLVVQGEWDRDTPPEMGLGVFANLTTAPQRRYLLLSGGTHLMMMERNRLQLFRAVQGFLEEKF